jgi:TonB family protein
VHDFGAHVRFLRPSIAVFVIALLASLCIHFPIYEVLGDLADRLLNQPVAERHAPVEFELAPLGKSDVPEPKPKDTELPPEPKAKDKQAKKEPPPEPQKKLDPQQQQDTAKPLPLPEPEIVKAEPQPVPQRPDNPLAVTQKSDNPDVPPPDDAKYIAEENRRVEQESIATMRNMQRDDPKPMANASPKQTQEEEGNSDKTEIEDLQDVHGSKERTPNPAEASTKPQHESEPSAGKREAQAVAPAPAVSQAPSKAVNPQRATGSPQTGGEPDKIVVSDGVGTFTIRKQPQGKGPGDAGGAQKPGDPSPDRNNREGARAQNGVNLRLSWHQFEDTYGADDLEAQRAAYLEQRKSSASGRSRAVKWKEFRAAIENFVPNVQPGTQTALNTAADPFAAWLAEAHRRIHREYAFGFLRSLPLAGGPFADPALHTELEIVINGDGSVHKVGVAESSGFMPFDYGAFDAVMRAAPYPIPPRKILSGDGRVYVHWGFYRNERQCGTFNARPYILPHPNDPPEPGKSPLHDDGPPPAHPSTPSGPVPVPADGDFGMVDPVLPARFASRNDVR